jgi:hypothetical protein
MSLLALLVQGSTSTRPDLSKLPSTLGEGRRTSRRKRISRTDHRAQESTFGGNRDDCLCVNNSGRKNVGRIHRCTYTMRRHRHRHAYPRSQWNSQSGGFARLGFVELDLLGEARLDFGLR